MGSPKLKDKHKFNFTPEGINGMTEKPIFKGQVCYGIDLRNFNVDKLRQEKRINLSWIIELYKAHLDKAKIFDSSLSNEMSPIEYHIGSGLFREQIINGVT
ncbi:MAG: hypothetical protein ACJARX_001582 [Psychroserpens sp.]